MIRFAFIDQHRGDFRLDVLCRMLDVTRSGYFAWRGRPISTRACQDQQLSAEIVGIHAWSKGRYGVPRVHAELQARGRACSRRRVVRLMRQAGLQGKIRRRCRTTTRHDPTTPPAPDLVQRDFSAPVTMAGIKAHPVF